ncbi:MAG: hypothetical protein JNK28_11325 [Burkholderiaceae bacterium]|jgi:hypothetical protein|nr:hypothetical protein [Burkholderiaceae bacterium]
MKLNAFVLIVVSVYVALVGLVAASVPGEYLGTTIALAVIGGILVGLFVLDEVRTIEKARQRGQSLVPWKHRARQLLRGTPFRVIASLCVAAVVASAASAWMKAPAGEAPRPMPSLTTPTATEKVGLDVDTATRGRVVEMSPARLA